MKQRHNSATRITLATAFSLLLIILIATANAAETSSQFSAASAWRPGVDFLSSLHATCDSVAQSPTVLQCVTEQMKKAGAPADAVHFTQELFESKHQVGIMGAFRSFPPLGLTWVIYPFRQDAKDGLLFVNSHPNFLDPNDLQNVDRAALEQDSTFQQWQKANPKLTIWPSDVPAGESQVKVARVYGGDKPGEQKFLYSYRLASGCPTCSQMGFANYWWLFDADGKFLGSKLASVARGMPPARRRPDAEAGEGPPAPSAAPAPPAAPPHN
jgi:hypothetical protein